MKWFDNILEELGDPAIFLVSVRQFTAVMRLKDPDYDLGDAWGDSDADYSIVTVVPGMTLKARDNTAYHELFHLLFSSWDHTEIELCAERMAGGGGKGEYTKIYGRDVREALTKKEIRILARRASKRYNER